METCKLVSREDCLKIIQKHAVGKFELTGYKILPLGDEPLGFMGEHFRLQITVKTWKTKNVSLHFFMKTVPNTAEIHRNYINNIGCFAKEALLYKELFTNLQSYIETQFAPNCYLVSTHSHLVLEDLSLNGFMMIKNKSETLDFAHCKCVIETLARFHAASIIYEEKRSATAPYRIYDHFQNMLFETTFSFQPGHPRNDWLNITIETLVDVCGRIDEYKDRNVETVIKDLAEKMQEYIKPSKIFRNVINHGDLWSNNIMFKYSENSTPEHCVLVDFQMARYIPPAVDFLTFLYLTTTEQIHQKYFTTFVDMYYCMFAQELKRHHLNPEMIMSKASFIECCKYYKEPCLFESAMFATIVYLNCDFSKDMLSDCDKFMEFMHTNRSKLVCKQFDQDPVFRHRLESVIVQLLKFIL